MFSHLIFTVIITGLTANEGVRYSDINDGNLHRIRPGIPPDFNRHDNKQTIFNSNTHENSRADTRQHTITHNYKMALNNLINNVNTLTASLNNFKQTLNKHTAHNLLKNTNVRYKRGANETTDNATTDKISTVLPLNATDNKIDIKTDCTGVSGRRSTYRQTGLIKQKLLLYLEEGFHDVEERVVSLGDVKQMFADVLPYRIGYIVANIDTLAVNLRNLREDVGVYSGTWGEGEILEVYDRLKTSSSLIAKLLDTLRTYAGAIKK